jgi:hypothetical protein
MKELLAPRRAPELAAVAPGGWLGAGSAEGGLAADHLAFGEPVERPVVRSIFDGEKDDLAAEGNEDHGLKGEDALFQDQSDGEGGDLKAAIPDGGSAE